MTDSATIWFMQRADGSLHDPETNSEVTVIRDPSVPSIDWVRLPPNLGGQSVRVHSESITPCPRCEHPVQTFGLANQMRVAVCSQSRHANPIAFYTLRSR